MRAGVTIGRPPKPYNGKFATIPRKFDGCVYAAEMHNGIVKVGFSRNPRTRLTTLATHARRHLSTDIKCFHVSQNLGARVAMACEGRVLRRLSQMGSTVYDSKEFFAGIRFGTAAQLVDQIVRAALRPIPEKQGA